MYLIIVSIIYRNKFQKPDFFFASKDFLIGSVIFVPYSKKEKPAIVLKTDTIEKQKSFIRKNKIKIKKITNNFEKRILNAETFQQLNKYPFPINEILQKIIPIKIIKQLNNFNPEKDNLPQIKISPTEIQKKFSPVKTQKKETGVSSIGEIISLPKNNKSKIYSEKHYLTEEIRKYFKEENKKGPGSFSFYLGFFKRIPEQKIYQFWSEAKQAKKPLEKQKKIFWWKIGQFLKDLKNK